MTTVVDADGRSSLGMISDGDLRRQMERDGYALLDRTAGAVHDAGRRSPSRRARARHRRPRRHGGAARSRRCPWWTTAGVVDGVVHLHDLWKTEMI